MSTEEARNSNEALEGWAFVVDTERYTGDVERPLVAYMTGKTGECGVGQRQADVALGELAALPTVLEWLEQHVVQKPDEHGCNRPAAIYPTPGWFNDGMGGHYRDDTDPTVVQATYGKAVADYWGPRAEEQEQRATKTTGEVQADALRFAAEYRAKIADAKPGHFPAYQSVAAWLDAEPPAEVLVVLKARAASYAATKRVRVTGYRVVETITLSRWRNV